jgi:hypothetical protein
MVLKSLYDSALEQIDKLSQEIEDLKLLLGERDSRIKELESELEQSLINLEGEILKANIASEQSTIANEQIGETTIDLSNAIQNSINEAISRVSLTARVEALLQENESLREQLFGLSAQTAEGAISGGDNGFTVKVNNPDGDASQLSADLWAKTSHKAGSGRKMTNTIEVSNVTTDNKITNIAFVFDGNPKWFKVKSGASSIEPETSETYDCEYQNIGGPGTPAGNRGGISPRRRRIGWKGKGQNYTGLSLRVDVIFADGSTDTVSLSTNLRKNKKS